MDYAVTRSRNDVVFFFSFVGFIDKAASFAPSVGFNLTFSCPTGQVFERDWLAIPFVMMTCQVMMMKKHFNLIAYK
jgi:hypothetical protein